MDRKSRLAFNGCYACCVHRDDGVGCDRRRNLATSPRINPHQETMEEFVMGRYLLLWLLGVPIPILVLIYAFGGLH
jgi:hypothetical protein